MSEAVLKRLRESIRIPGVKRILRGVLTGYYGLVEALTRSCATGWRLLSRRVPRTIDPHQLRRIVVFRSNRVGDVILATPMLAALRRRYPSGVIAVVVTPYTAALLEGHPHVDQLIIYDRRRGGRARQALVHQLRQGRFDAALIVDPYFESAWAAFRAGIPLRVGLASHGSGGVLTHRADGRLRYRHEAHTLLGVASLLNVNDHEPLPTMQITPEARQFARELFAAHRLDGQLVVGMHPGAYWSHHRWPAESFAALADRLMARQVPVVVFAGPQDHPVLDAMTRRMRAQPVPAVDLSLQRVAALMARCRVVVGNNSGPMHIASAVGSRVVALFGRWSFFDSAQKWGPCGPGHRVVLPTQSSDIHQITVEQVEEAVLQQLGQA